MVLQVAAMAAAAQCDVVEMRAWKHFSFVWIPWDSMFALETPWRMLPSEAANDLLIVYIAKSQRSGY